MRILDYPSTEVSRKLAEKYGYDEFIVRRWLKFFGDECLKIIEAFERGIPKYIRVNTIKIREREVIERLESRGFELRKTEVKYCYEIIREPFSIGATPEFLMGYYYVMDKSSCIPPLALSPKAGELVVDLAASPGGKTTFLSQLMDNRGVVLAIEPQKDRIEALVHNVNRMGAMNVAVLRMDAREFARFMIESGRKADRVLLDAPCSGEGIIHKDLSRKRSRGKKDIEFCSYLQRDLILPAFDLLKRGGIMVYSTCSMTPEENEFVVEYLLENRGDAEVIEIPHLPGDPPLDLSEMKKGKIEFAKRLYPHKHRTSGFFVVKIRKR